MSDRSLEQIEHANAICYSGYREGQRPGHSYPSYEEIHEDLTILVRNWRYLRVYDPSPHAETMLRVIRDHNLPFKVLLGMDLGAEVSNPRCPWGAEYSDAELARNRRKNEAQVVRVVELAREYSDEVFCVSIGNEAAVEWNDHMVPVDRLCTYADRVRSRVPQPVTFCDNYVPWTDVLEPLVEKLDVISVHTYPAWEFKTIDDALDYSMQNYEAVRSMYPDKQVIITEAGWTTASNGRGIEPANASEEIQALYYRQLVDWSNEQEILTFVFEAFDEPWKGSPDPLEPEKHWGLFDVQRRPKLVMRTKYPDLAVELDTETAASD